MIRFGAYCLDPTQGLTRGVDEIRLTPKSLLLLQVLAERAGRLVPKDELFRVVWRGTAVSDAALATCIQEVRQALADDARVPRFIQTVHRRGYRFIAPVSQEPASLQARAAPASGETPLVGRDWVIEDLRRAFALAETGMRQVWFISGEPGVGKSRVLQAFLTELTSRGRARIASGQCVEHYGAGEPYQPLLDAMMRLCRQPGGDRFVGELERYAPTWLAQLTGMLSPEKHAALLRTLPGTTRDRMVRELTNAIEAITAHAPLVVCLEDLQWSDVSTLDWIVACAQRPEAARLLLIGTFRSTVAPQDRPVTAITDPLRAKGLCSEIALMPLNERGVVDYVRLRFPTAGGADGVTRLARRIHAHTGGNPLYVVNVLADLVGRQVLAKAGPTWRVRDDADTVDLGVSDDIRRIIERQVERLSSEERAVLEVASVAGGIFPAALVASAAEAVNSEADRRLAGLARHGQFIRETGVVDWPDGTVSTQFAFDHALYRDVLYRSLSMGRRADLHRRIGDCLERAFGSDAPQRAAELAMHFDEGREARRAALYRQHAAENARGRSAFNEARMHFERALALIASLPATEERTEREATLQIGLGAAIMATRGFGAPDAEAAYSRARTLCGAAGDTPRLFPALWGLWLFYWGRGAVQPAHELAQELTARAVASGDEALRLQAHHASWATAFSRGDLIGACASAAEGMRLYDPNRHAAMAATYGSHDAGVCARMFMARALTLRGRVDEAMRVSDEAIALARALEHPFSIALAITFRAASDHSRNDAAATRLHAGVAAGIASEQDFRLMRAWCAAIGGWASIEGTSSGFIDTIVEAIAAARTSGSDQFLPQLLAARADGCLKAHRPQDGLNAIDEALAIASSTGERFFDAELHRLRGELIVAGGGAVGDAEAAFVQAVDVATSQQAALFALRASISLGRLWCRIGKTDQARRLIVEALAGVPEGSTTPDALEAAAIIGS